MAYSMQCSYAVQMLSEASEHPPNDQVEHLANDQVELAQEVAMDVNTNDPTVRCILSLRLQTHMV